MFKTNRALRKTIDYLKTELSVARAERITAVNVEKERADLLDKELNGTPFKAAPWGLYQEAIPGVKEQLQRAERQLRYAQSDNANLAQKLARAERHNTALREALTALGGAVIELQDVEVKA